MGRVRAGVSSILRDCQPRKMRDFVLENAAGVGSSYTLPLGLLRFLLPLVVHTPVEEASRKVSRVRERREGPGPMISTPTVQRAESRTPESS
jgi:hypothetical protein